MKPGAAFRKVGKSVNKSTKRFISFSLDLSIQIHEDLIRQNKKPVDLARKLKKSESEISKWLSGQHNFTVKSIVRLENALGYKLIYTKAEVEKEFVLEIKSLKAKLKELESKNVLFNVGDITGIQTDFFASPFELPKDLVSYMSDFSYRAFRDSQGINKPLTVYTQNKPMGRQISKDYFLSNKNAQIIEKEAI